MLPSSTSSQSTSSQIPQRRGQILILFAFFFIFIMGVFIANYNIGDLVRQKIQLQNAADAASLAAARSLGLGMGFMVLVNDMVLSDLSTGLSVIIAELAVPIIGWSLAIPSTLALLGKLVIDFEIGNSYMLTGPFLAQEAAAVVGHANGAEFAWALLDDSWTGMNTGSGAKLTLNVPDITNWSSIYSDIFLHLIWPRTDTSFPEKAVVVAWNLYYEPVLFGSNSMDVVRREMHAVSTSTIYYVPQAITEDFKAGYTSSDHYNGRMTEMADDWFIWSPWFPGPYWQPRLIPNNNFDATIIGYLPIYADYNTSYDFMKSFMIGFGLDADDLLNMVGAFSSTFSFLGDALSAINGLDGS